MSEHFLGHSGYGNVGWLCIATILGRYLASNQRVKEVGRE